jgi:hypothetical protein
MYRIEVASGEETVFRTIEELAIGIRNGVVTPRARIYHHASEKWLPIGLHPHYKKALEMPAASASPAPVTSTTPIPTPSRPKAHPPSHPKPHSVVHFPEPERAPVPKPTPELKPVTIAAPAPKVPAPVQSPVIAMQNEVLRDLPVISIPEPLPWTVKKPSPAVAPTVQTYAPAVDPPASSAPAVHAPKAHAPLTHAPLKHAPLTHAPLTHAPATHAPATHAPATHPTVTHAPAKHAPVPRAPEPYRSMEHLPPVEERLDDDATVQLFRRPTARRSRRMRGRPLVLLGAAAALVAGTHLVLTATPSMSADPAEAPAPADPAAPPAPAAVAERKEVGQPAAETSSAETRATEAPRVTSAPARVSMIPGPAFAGSVPARPGADAAGTPKVTTRAAAPAPAPPEPSIAPAPAAIELALPGLPPDSIVRTARTSDTMAMKRILRALNGPKPAEGSAAP